MAFNLTLPIAIGADHAGFECKEKLISLFEELNLLKEPSLFFRVNPHWVSIFLMKFSNNMHWENIRI